MLKYAIIALVVLIALVLVAKSFGRRPKLPVAPDQPRILPADSGAVAAEIDGQELDIDPATLADIRALATGGRKLEAIQRLRDATDLDLARAKDIVDSLERMHVNK
jgi:ribosomal protein L7/L12